MCIAMSLPHLETLLKIIIQKFFHLSFWNMKSQMGSNQVGVVDVTMLFFLGGGAGGKKHFTKSAVERWVVMMQNSLVWPNMPFFFFFS
jgi:hypothetical protein